MTFVQDRLKDIQEVTKDAGTAFRKLNFQQLNWKPSEKQWSVAQCLRHIIIANSSYFPVLEKIIKGEKKNSFWERNSPLSNFWGKFLINVIKPENTRKARTFKVFKPANISEESDIVNDFTTHQQDLVDYVSKMQDSDLMATKITSPASRFINYSLRDLLLIITLHEQRHLQQARRVIQSENFPR
jgi:hypothetical protein